MKRKYKEEEVKFCNMDTDTFIVYIKIGDIYVDIVKDVKRRFHTSNHELQRSLYVRNSCIFQGILRYLLSW